MIQPATLPATAKSLLAIDPQAANGATAAFETRFSALLAANFMPTAADAPGKAEAAPDPAFPVKAQLRPASGKADGKMPGKILPDSPALAAFASLLKPARGTVETSGNVSLTQAGQAQAGWQKADLAIEDWSQEDSSTEDWAQTAETAPDASVIANQLPIPAFAIPVASNPGLGAAPASGPPAAQASALPLPVAEQAQVAAIASSQIMPAIAGAQHQLGASSAPAKTTPAALAGPVTAGQAPEFFQSRPELQPVMIQAGLTTRVVLVPRGHMQPGELGKLQTMAIEQAKIGEAGQQLAKVQVLQAPEDPAARTVTSPAQISPAQISLAPASSAAEAREAPAAKSTASGDAEKSQKALPPASAQPDATSFFQASPAAVPVALAAGATSPAAAPSRTPDFAALIDRLVEARAAAQATREPHTVNAAIQHAEFGHISLQFQQDAAGLSVVMASADPELAKALQVAAPGGSGLAGQFAGSSDGNAPQWRQDASSQASNGTGQTQSQNPQHRGQAPQRAPDPAMGAANPASRSRNQTDQTARSGIFA